MLSDYAAKYRKTGSDYMAQPPEWPDVLNQGSTLEGCSEILKNALHEMTRGYAEQEKEIPVEGPLFDEMSVEV